MGRKYCLNYFSLNARSSKSESMLSNNHYFEVRVIYYTITLQIHLNDYNTHKENVIKYLCQVSWKKIKFH